MSIPEDNYQHVSTVFDNYGNRVERYESTRAVNLRVKLSPRSQRTAEEVTAWYWRFVGAPMPQTPDAWAVDPEHPSASLYTDYTGGH